MALHGEGPTHGTAMAVADALGARGEAHVWWWRTPEHTDPADLPLLDTEEFRRALSLPAERDAAAFVRSRAAARRALAGLFGIEPREIALGRRNCPGCGDGSHGPPKLVVPSLRVALSMSRTAGCGIFAVGAGSAIGVDAESLRPVRGSATTDADLTAAEQRYLGELAPGPERDEAFHRIWTRKEAVVKATGLGLSGVELGRLETHPARSGPVRVTHTHRGRTSAWTVEDLELLPDVAVALARPAGPAAHGPVHRHTDH
ncbi:4'-phosphopantetheinyl transferase superfamily protein [Streptomyces sp. NBC_00249]|uniref:4'-phosphopantetheinyl transferase family protein n=1 Tax=Streptomyces sp. NBC_00249 TaxID=2975690 RepID=UPI002253B422|nr:4'-phosphopantetheinyl transferase superfamily protein [Streptomyces sp. NBC_00249]MCX5193826.1 4'-phosphopantetheinyl transferase superfamily protein [Streptomyces sp. NBC_00249]